MSTLIDKLVDDYGNKEVPMESIGAIWYIAKPYNCASFMSRIKDAIRIINKKSFAVHFSRDEIKLNN
jgi:hypothetical protein